MLLIYCIKNLEIILEGEKPEEIGDYRKYCQKGKEDRTV